MFRVYVKAARLRTLPLSVSGIIVGVIYYLMTRKHGKSKSGEKIDEDDLEQIIRIIIQHKQT